MGLFKKIMAGPETVGKVIDGTTSAIDKFTFTNQERAAASTQSFELYIRLMEATSGQNLARRYIALVVVGLWAALVAIGAALGVFEFLVLGRTENTAAAYVLDLEARLVSPLAITVVGFYFSKGMIDQGIRVWADRKQGRKGRKGRGKPEPETPPG